MGLPIPGDRFARDYGCTESDWLGWIPAAVHGHAWQHDGAAALKVNIGGGHVRMAWHMLEPRRIALVRLPRLMVQFAFEGVAAAERDAFMRHFDLRTQRGGG
jgi:hypothetical protein